jgi:hypothetical protein
MGHWYVNPHQTFDAVTQELYPIPYMVSYRAATFGIHQFWAKVVNYSDTTGYSTIQSSYDTWLPVWSFISRYPQSFSTSRYLLSVVSMNLNEKNVDV